MAPTTSTRIASGLEPSPAGTPTPVRPASLWPSETPVTTDTALALLENAPIRIVGRLVDASNATFYCELGDDGAPAIHAVYKPIEGERPLDDFPDGTLAYREVAAWLVSQASGLELVPPTILRDGPFGPGMLQLWIDVDGEVDPLALVLTRDPRLRRIALLDLVMNNADRKGGHLLPTAGGAILGCDHGICFASEPKLRTVLWGWAGDPFDDADRSALDALGAAMDEDLGRALARLLSPGELDSTRARLEALLRRSRFPTPDPGRRVIPWPPF